MIDMHIHVVPPDLPGVGDMNLRPDGGAEAVAARLREEMVTAGVHTVLAMGCISGDEADPLGIRGTLEIASSVPGLNAIGVANPMRVDREHLRRVESTLAAGRVKALKAYLGYLHCGPDHPGYRPYFELAERFKLPVIFHTGDTYSPYAKVRFAQPLLVDDVAVDHPNVRFVLAHCGNPWLIDAAEVVYKNVNVWADLSALIIGDVSTFLDEERQDILRETALSASKAFRYAERPNRFLYGSDWPLAPMAPYRDFIRAIIPDTYHEMVFEENARRLFGV
jgi:predicted TIM-barrel fold metal-dependent hydrolase